jgi:hypothetical protein
MHAAASAFQEKNLHLQARERSDAAGSAHGCARDSNGLGDVKKRHGRLQ